MSLNPLLEWDRALFLKINGLAGGMLDYFFGWPTHLGEFYFFLPVVFLLLLIWNPEKALPHFIFIALCVLAAGLFNSLLKDLIDRPRPWSYFYHAIDQGLVQVHFLFAIDTAESFPSGHTTAVFSLATALCSIYGRKMAGAFIFAAWIGLTRVFCGAHFPLDVLAGAAVGICVTKIVSTLWVFAEKKTAC